MIAELEERLIDIEMRFMQQESTIQDLNEVVISQGKTINSLTLEVEQLKAQMKGMEPSIIRSPSEETPPPHY